MNNKKYTQLKEKENEQIWNVKGIYLENTDSSRRERTEMGSHELNARGEEGW